MSADLSDATVYWSRVAREKEFTHPLDLELLERWLPRREGGEPRGEILDLGCGYGRLCEELRRAGHAVIGVDAAPGMIERGREEHPELDLRHVPPGLLPFGEARFDAVLLFSVLTCVPGDLELEALVAEARRVLCPGGLVYVSDLFLQPDERNRTRYAAGEREHGVRGVFELPEGVRLRHFPEERLETLFGGFERLELVPLRVTTMNGHAARGFQLLARRGSN